MKENMMTNRPTLRERVNAKLAESGKTKAAIGASFGVARSVVSNYLNGKPVSMSDEKLQELEHWLEEWLFREGEASCYADIMEHGADLQAEDDKEPADPVPKKTFQKPEVFESDDYLGILGICTLCQENQELGIIVGKSGFGKTYSLKQFAKLQRAVRIECNETMNCKDIVRKIETAVGLPKGPGSIDERLDRIYDFFNTNKGYLLIIDEADKLISKYTIKKIELMRNIADCSTVGVVLAGEPALESSLRAYNNRFANRMDLIYKLHGLTRKEVKRYFKDFDVEPDALEEFYRRACNASTGCFRLLDRTLNNVMRILRTNDKKVITYDVIREASSMMIL